MEEFKVTIHMVASLDGFVAKTDNSVSWFDTVDYYEQGVTGENAEDFMKTIDCFVMGSRTYQHALQLEENFGWAYGDTPTIVVSRRELPLRRKNVEIYKGGLEELVSGRLNPRYRNVWLVGGPTLAREFIKLKLAGEIRLSIIPIILGDGLSFFGHIGQEQALHLKNVTAYKTGMVELCYQIKNNPL